MPCLRMALQVGCWTWRAGFMALPPRSGTLLPTISIPYRQYQPHYYSYISTLHTWFSARTQHTPRAATFLRYLGLLLPHHRLPFAVTPSLPRTFARIYSHDASVLYAVVPLAALPGLLLTLPATSSYTAHTDALVTSIYIFLRLLIWRVKQR